MNCELGGRPALAPPLLYTLLTRATGALALSTSEVGSDSAVDGRHDAAAPV